MTRLLQENVIRYTVKEESLPVHLFRIERTSKSDLRIEAEYNEDKYIYTHQKSIDILIRDGLITTYQIAGEQQLNLNISN